MSETGFQDLVHLSSEFDGWIGKVKEQMNCKTSSDFSLRNLKKLSVDVLAKFLFDGCNIGKQCSDAAQDAKNKAEFLKSEIIESQRKQIKLQDMLIQTQSVQLTQDVEKAIEKGMKSYSNVLASSPVSNSEPNFTEKKLKKVVQEAVAEEDRSRNVVIFGLSEETSEDLDGKVTALFEEIEERPSFEATRVGRVSDKTTRPVKVSLRNSDIVHGLLSKAKQLKETTAYKKVFIAPDRSPEERIKHRKLVTEMREQARENPNQYYFIYAGSIGHRDRRTSETRESQAGEIRVHEQIYRVKQTARTSECESSGVEEDE